MHGPGRAAGAWGTVAEAGMSLIALITVPYDSGHRARRMGNGPLQVVEGGALARIEGAGHTVRHIQIELENQFWTEVGVARQLQQLVSVAVRDARSRGE